MISQDNAGQRPISPAPTPSVLFQPQAVRFASTNQEIEPAQSIPSSMTFSSGKSISDVELSSEAQEEIRNLSLGIRHSDLQQRRLSNFAFEPVSLPASRVHSNESAFQNPSREATRSGGVSPKPSPSLLPPSPPPLTPASTNLRSYLRSANDASGPELAKVDENSSQGASQISSSDKIPARTASDGLADRALFSSAATSRPSSVSDQTSTRPTSPSRQSSGAEFVSKPSSAFFLGASEDPLSKETSTPASGGASGESTPPIALEKPLNPAGDPDGPYARSKRPPPPKNLDSIDQRFVFGGKDSRRRSGFVPSNASAASLNSLPRANSGNEVKASNDHKSGFSLHSLGGRKDHFGHLHDESLPNNSGKPHGSMTELKRFFGLGHKSKRSQSPSASAKSSTRTSGTRTPPHQFPPSNVPFADDHGLQTKYGKFGKMLGSGAGGSVRLMKRSSDGVTFAVKQFRDKHSHESEREYAKKVTAEFCIGSTLHHGNIIETLDIVHERGHWYEVMEYAPYDLFAIVMTGKMSREEVSCSFLQIVSGVQFLHGMGLAHRDLKLDNVVVSEHGIMKIIDFGSASVFRYPFENDIVLATGIVGSDPYLAPEVYDLNKYDPQPTDIWSLAIIYACMSLRRFPWKAPRLTDNSYKLFVSTPTTGTAETGMPRSSDGRPKSALELTSAAGDSRRSSDTTAKAMSRQNSEDGPTKHHHHHHHHHHHQDKDGAEPSSTGQNTASTTSSSPQAETPSTKQEVLKGPWRLLRLLPRESRAIIGKMLEILPSRRATLADMMKDPWIANTQVCRQLEGGQVVRAPGHEHTLEAGTAAASAPHQK